MIGDRGECTPISITSTPQPVIVIPDNSNGTNIGLVTLPGQVCSSQFLAMESEDITGVDCVGDNSGAIDITVSGGSGIYSYNWSGPGIVTPADRSQTSLPNGTFYLTVTDNVLGNLILKDTLVVGFSANAPVAEAGEDTTLPLRRNFDATRRHRLLARAPIHLFVAGDRATVTPTELPFWTRPSSARVVTNWR